MNKEKVKLLLIHSQKKPLIITLLYCLLGGVWILFSDKWLLHYFPQSTDHVFYQTVKGWFFVIATGFGLFLLLKLFFGALARSEKELKESHRFISTLLNNLPGMVYRCRNDRNWTMEFVSEGCISLTGYTSEELIKQKGVTYGQIIHPDDREKVWNEVQSALKNKSAFKITYRIICKDGQTKWVYEQGAGVKQVSTILMIEGFITDITDQKKAEQEIRILNTELDKKVKKRTAQLESANKELEAFTYSVSHDLRAPLRAIDGFSKIVMKEHSTQLDEEGLRFLNIVRDNIQKMNLLINDLLALSRVGRKKINFASIDFRPIIESIQEDLKTTFGNRKITLNLKDLPVATGDKFLLTQVWQNLLSNAVKYTGSKERPEIEIGGESNGKMTTYYIKDNGVGFDMKYASKLFEVFQRLHREEDFEGTGVGLSIVQRIIHRHGGKVWAQSTLNEGSTFYFSLPKNGEKNAIHQSSGNPVS